MKRVALVGLILLVALLTFSCAQPTTILEISVEETQEGIIIKNTGNVDCIVFVTWPDKQEHFDLAVGQSQIVEDAPKPSSISAVKK